MIFVFMLFNFLSSSFSKTCRPKLEKTSRRRKNRETLVQAFRWTASPAAYPGEALIFGLTKLIDISAPLEIPRQSRS